MKQQMNASACASRRNTIAWNRINWTTAKDVVKRLQMRIAKAVSEKRWGKVKALQHLLTHSFYAKALAVKRVTQNRGKNTPGVDGILWLNADAKWRAIGTLHSHGYRAKPLRRIYIPKRNGKLRPLGIPTMRDRAIQALYRLALDPIAEMTADIDSYGFRPERSTADAIEACFNVLARRGAVKWVLEADIKGCFDNIRHPWLLQHIPLPKQILRQWLDSGFIERGQLFATAAGTPQGGIISPTLANMTLDGLQKAVESISLDRYKKPRFRLIRYADDFIVTGASKQALEQEVLPVVRGFLQIRGLELSAEKTRVTHIDQGFDFLGQNLRKYKGKLLIKPSRKNTQAFLDNIRDVIKSQPQVATDRLISQLNPKILGWANYHQHIVASQTFNKMRASIFSAVRRWARRRHPTKSKAWVDRKYFRCEGLKQWVFFANKVTSSGEQRTLRLACATDVPIQRHIKIRREAHPYDPEFSLYLLRRRLRKQIIRTRRREMRRNLTESN